MDHDGRSLTDSGLTEDASINGYDALFEQIPRSKEESEITQRSGDPSELMQEEKALQEQDYARISGAARYGLHSLYGLRWSREDPQLAAREYQSATETMHASEGKDNYDSYADRNRQQLVGLSNVLRNSTIAAMAPNTLEAQKIVAEQQRSEALSQIDWLAKQPYYAFNGLFRSQLDQDSFISQLELKANIIRDRSVNRLNDQELIEKLSDQSRMKVLTLQAMGNSAGARREEIDNQFVGEELSAGNDLGRLGSIQNLHRQTLKNFDADVERQRKLQASRTEDNIAGYKEESHEAELRAEGKNDEAKIDALKFAAQQRVRSLQEQADAEGDPTRKAQLQNEASAAAEAGKSEVDSLRKEMQRESQSSPGNTGSPHLGGDVAANLADAVKKLDDAATKLDKALSGGKSISLLKE